MTDQLIDILRAKIAAYTWRYSDIPSGLLFKEYLISNVNSLKQSDKVDRMVTRIVFRALESNILDHKDLTQAGYSAITHEYYDRFNNNISSSHH